VLADGGSKPALPQTGHALDGVACFRVGSA